MPLETVSFIMSRSAVAVSGFISRIDPVDGCESLSISVGSSAMPPFPTAAAISAACIGESFTSPNPAALLANSKPESGMSALDCSTG